MVKKIIFKRVYSMKCQLDVQFTSTKRSISGKSIKFNRCVAILLVSSITLFERLLLSAIELGFTKEHSDKVVNVIQTLHSITLTHVSHVALMCSRSIT